MGWAGGGGGLVVCGRVHVGGRPVAHAYTLTHKTHQSHTPTEQPHGPGPVLSSLVGAPPLASPLILTVLSLLCPETQARPRPPAPEVVAAAKSLRELRWGF